MEETVKKLYPVKFIPIAEKVSWGGSALIKKFRKDFVESNEKGDEVHLTDKDKVGESWEIADMGFRDSLVSHGWLAGNTISELMETYMERVVGDNVFEYYGRQFPLLVKLLDVKGRTPVLAHPDDETAEERYDALGKTKMWYIQDAEPGASVCIGFKRDITAQEFYRRCLDGTLVEVLNVIHPKKGDAFLIKPDVVHCACDGLIIAEVAESSDLDFKLYNWGKPTENDSDERLTADEALDFLDFKEFQPEGQFIKGALWPDSDLNQKSHGHDNLHKIATEIVSCPQFKITELHLSDALHIYAEKFSSFIIYICLDGEASIQMQSASEEGDEKMENFVLKAGETILIPNDITDFFLVPRDRSTLLLEAMIEKRSDPDPYINPDAKAHLDGEDYDALEEDEDDEELDRELQARLHPDGEGHCHCGDDHCHCEEDGDDHCDCGEHRH